MNTPSPRHAFGHTPGLLTSLVLASFFGGCSSSSDNGTNMPPCPAADDLISDFTMDNGVKPIDGRQGGWYTYADRSGFGTLTPPEGGGVTPDTTEGNTACSGPGSLHVTAVNFTDWGAAMGTDFKAKTTNPAGLQAKGTYDASKYKGISFWAKAKAPIKFAMVKLLDPYTEIPSVLPAGEECMYKANTPKNCSPYIVKFGYGYTGDDAAAVVTDYPKYVDTKIDITWKYFEILFADAKQDQFNTGQKSPGDKLDTAQLVGMAIQINTDHSTVPPTNNDFEIWVDDVAFVK